MCEYYSSKVTIHPPLEGSHLAYLMRFKAIRHMKRDVKILEKLRDPLRTYVSLPLGEEGQYYVAGERHSNYMEDSSILEHNWPPREQPSLWCPWEPSPDGCRMVWSGRTDRYSYEEEWLKYLDKHFYSRWGYELRGTLINRVLGG